MLTAQCTQTCLSEQVCMKWKNNFKCSNEGESNGTGMWMYVIPSDVTSEPSFEMALSEFGIARLMITWKPACEMASNCIASGWPDDVIRSDIVMQFKMLLLTIVSERMWNKKKAVDTL